MTKVLKFGGTSVGTPERMSEVFDIIDKTCKEENTERLIIVLSALSGVTNMLVNFSEFMFNNDYKKATAVINKLNKKYSNFIQSLYSKEPIREKAKCVIKTYYSQLYAFVEKKQFNALNERITLAQGELVSTALFHLYMQEKDVGATLIPALNFMRIDEHKEPILSYIKEHLDKELKKNALNQIFITQGYICRNNYGEIDNLKRGGSDYTASLIGAAIKANEIQIWTDIDGMHNNDPRFVERTYRIPEMSFDEAAELAYFGAKVLHPATILPAKEKNIPVRLLNTLNPGGKGTLISNRDSGKDILAMAAKDHITAIKIKSGRMLLAYGFLRHVFEVFERYCTPIDMITTSEVAVSLTIDNDEYLGDIKKDLEKYGSVEIDQELTIICIAGNFSTENYNNALNVFKELKNVPIRMISYGGSKKNISLLIKTEHKSDTLKTLNTNLFGL